MHFFGCGAGLQYVEIGRQTTTEGMNHAIALNIRNPMRACTAFRIGGLTLKRPKYMQQMDSFGSTQATGYTTLKA